MLPLGRIRGRKFFPYTVKPESKFSRPQGSKFFSFRTNPFQEGRQNSLTELPSLNMYPFPLHWMRRRKWAFTVHIYPEGIFLHDTTHKRRGGSRMVSERVQFDQITVLTLCIRKDKPEQTVKTQIRRRKTRRLIRVYTVCPSSSNFKHIHK